MAATWENLERHPMGRKAIAVAAILIVPAVVGGWRAVHDLFGAAFGPSRTTAVQPPTRQPSAPPTAAERTRAVAAPVAPATAAVPAVAARPAVTQEEAQDLVRDWFGALASGDYGRAEALTTGEAQVATRGLVDTVQGEASRQGVRVQVAVRRLAVAPAPPVPEGEAVQADFDLDINALIGPASIPARKIQGSATFVVTPGEGGPRIADTRDIIGLPAR